MLPLIILAGGAAIGTAAYFGIKTRCKSCESIFTLNKNCLVCGTDVCGECGIETTKIDYKNWPVAPSGRVCKVHEEIFQRQAQEMRVAIDESERVILYSKNFKGTTPAPLLNIQIETQAHTDRDDAEREIKILAALKGASSAIEVGFQRETQQDGNYKYSTWKYSAVV